MHLNNGSDILCAMGVTYNPVQGQSSYNCFAKAVILLDNWPCTLRHYRKTWMVMRCGVVHYDIRTAQSQLQFESKFHELDCTESCTWTSSSSPSTLVAPMCTTGPLSMGIVVPRSEQLLAPPIHTPESQCTLGRGSHAGIWKPSKVDVPSVAAPLPQHVLPFSYLFLTALDKKPRERKDEPAQRTCVPMPKFSHVLLHCFF